MRVKIPVSEADSFSHLADLTIPHLDQYTSLSLVIGPLTTGGCGSRKLNGLVFDAVIDGIAKKGIQVFDQLPFEEVLQHLVDAWHAEGNEGYPFPILDEFYRRVFETGVFEGGFAYVIPGWRGSTGTRWEVETLPVCGVELVHLGPSDIHELLTERGVGADECEELMRHIRRAHAE